MKRCPECGRTFTNNTLTNCLNDGAALVEDVPDTASYYGAPPPESLPLAYPEETASAYPAEPSSAYPAQASSPWANPEAAPFNYAAPSNDSVPPDYAAPPPNYAAPPSYFAAPQKNVIQVPWRRLSIACFVILGIVRLGLYAVQSQQTPSSLIGGTQEIVPNIIPIVPPSNPDLFPGLKLDNTLTDTPDAALRSSLIAAIKKGDAAEAKSYSKLDAAPLRSSYGGPALATELGGLKALQKAGTTKEERLTAQKFHTFQVNPEHTKAEVDEIETWSTITRSAASGEVTSNNPSSVNPQVVSLKRTAHGWMVENVQFYELQ